MPTGMAKMMLNLLIIIGQTSEFRFDTPLGDDNLRAENDSQGYKRKKNQGEEATISQNKVFNNMAILIKYLNL